MDNYINLIEASYVLGPSDGLKWNGIRLYMRSLSSFGMIVKCKHPLMEKT